MNRVFGRGGSTKAFGSSNAAPISETWAARATSSPASSTVRPPMRCLASWSGFRSSSSSRISSTRDQPTVYSEATISMRRCRVASSDGQRLGQEVDQEEDLDAPLPHPRHEHVVLVLGTLDPEHVVEQQAVVVRGCEPLQAQLGAVDHHLAEPAHLGVHTELTHRRSPLRGRTRRSCRHGLRRSSRCPPARRSRRADRWPRRTVPQRRPWGPSSRRRTAGRGAGRA